MESLDLMNRIRGQLRLFEKVRGEILCGSVPQLARVKEEPKLSRLHNIAWEVTSVLQRREFDSVRDDERFTALNNTAAGILRK